MGEYLLQRKGTGARGMTGKKWTKLTNKLSDRAVPSNYTLMQASNKQHTPNNRQISISLIKKNLTVQQQINQSIIRVLERKKENTAIMCQVHTI